LAEVAGLVDADGWATVEVLAVFSVLAAIAGWEGVEGFATGVIAAGVDVLETVEVAAAVETGAAAEGFVASGVAARDDVMVAEGFCAAACWEPPSIAA
jgi:hypothetical protein